jgi:hypothetical protein
MAHRGSGLALLLALAASVRAFPAAYLAGLGRTPFTKNGPPTAPARRGPPLHAGGGTVTIRRAEKQETWDQEETARFREALVKAAQAAKAKAAERTSPAAPAEFAPDSSAARASEARGIRAAASGAIRTATPAQNGEDSVPVLWSRLPGYTSWRALVKRATKKGYEKDGKTPRPRSLGFGNGAKPDDGVEEKMSAIGKWQRTDGPLYVQFAGATLMLVGFLNHIALNNQNGSGIEGLSQELFAMSILVLLLGGALQRNETPSE